MMDLQERASHGQRMESYKDPTVVVVKSGEYQVLQAEDAAE